LDTRWRKKKSKELGHHTPDSVTDGKREQKPGDSALVAAGTCRRWGDENQDDETKAHRQVDETGQGRNDKNGQGLAGRMTELEKAQTRFSSAVFFPVMFPILLLQFPYHNP